MQVSEAWHDLWVWNLATEEEDVSKLESTKMRLMRLMLGIAQSERRMIEKMMEGSRLHVIFHKEMGCKKKARAARL